MTKDASDSFVSRRIGICVQPTSQHHACWLSSLLLQHAGNALQEHIPPLVQHFCNSCLIDLPRMQYPGDYRNVYAVWWVQILEPKPTQTQYLSTASPPRRSFCLCCSMTSASATCWLQRLTLQVETPWCWSGQWQTPTAVSKSMEACSMELKGERHIG